MSGNKVLPTLRSVGEGEKKKPLGYRALLSWLNDVTYVNVKWGESNLEEKIHSVVQCSAVQVEKKTVLIVFFPMFILDVSGQFMFRHVTSAFFRDSYIY